MMATREETCQKERENDTANEKPFSGIERNENATIDRATLLKNLV